MTAGAADAPSRTVTILHTNDIHGHVEPWTGWGELAGRHFGGLDRLAAAVKRVRSEVGTEKVLLLDAGDAFGDTMIAERTKGRALVEAMNAIGYDAMTIGNHDFDFGPQALAARIREARFPILAANVVRTEDARLYAAPYIVRVVNGVRIGVLGLAYPSTPDTTAPKNVAGVAFQLAEETVRAFLPRMRAEGAQLVVVLSHHGLDADRALARAVEGIDVIVGGHSHNRLQEAEREGRTLIVQAGAHGSDLGRLDLELADGQVVAHRRLLLPVESSIYEPDPEVAAVVQASLRAHAAELNERVGEATSLVARAQVLGGAQSRPRDQQSPADFLFADFLRQETRAEVALLPGVDYGVALQPGPLRAADVRNLVPHDSRVVTLSLTGTQIREILEQSLENVYAGDARAGISGVCRSAGWRSSTIRAPRAARV